MLTNPTLSNAGNRQRSITPNPRNYEEFLDFLYDDLDFIFGRLQQNKNIYYDGMANNSKNGEDLINVTICDMLSSRGWNATHDTNVNGHADIVVTLPFTNYQWLGEGKILNSNNYLYKGIKQLLYRYSTGIDGQNAGGIIAYINKGSKNAKDHLQDWYAYFSNQNSTASEDSNKMPYSPIIRTTNPCPKNSLAFRTCHQHSSSGLEYNIRHMIIDFRYEPKD